MKCLDFAIVLQVRRVEFVDCLKTSFVQAPVPAQAPVAATGNATALPVPAPAAPKLIPIDDAMVYSQWAQCLKPYIDALGPRVNET